ADAGGRLGPEIGLKQAEHRTQNIEIGHPKFSALLFEPLGELAIEQCVEDNARCSLHFAEHAIELPLAANERVNMLDRRNSGVLRGCRTGDSNQRFSGRVGDEMKVKIASSAARHGKRGRTMWIDGEEATVGPVTQAVRLQAWCLFGIGIHRTEAWDGAGGRWQAIGSKS